MKRDSIQDNLSERVKIEKENISKITNLWWNGEEMNNIHKASYYNSRMLLIKYKSEKLKNRKHDAGEEYTLYLQKCNVKKRELFIFHPDIL